MFDGGLLGDDQNALRQFYGDILTFAATNKAITDGAYFDLTNLNLSQGNIPKTVHAFGNIFSHGAKTAIFRHLVWFGEDRHKAEMAETEGFEPSVPDLPVRRFSKPLVSATHPRLRIAAAKRAYSGAGEGRQGGSRKLRLHFAASRNRLVWPHL